MPIYMDRHIVPGIEAKHAAEAHREDLKIQHEYGCRCMTYWVDEGRGCAFCLIDAPDKEAVIKMHDRAHGLIPHDIIQVNSNVVEAFLGRIDDPAGYFDGDDPDLKVINDPAFRIIVVFKVENVILLKHSLGVEKTNQLYSLYTRIVRKQVQDHEGREVRAEGQGSIISFVSVTQAVKFALAVRSSLHVAGELLKLKIAIHGGMPVSKSKEIFGETVKMANYLCRIGPDSQIQMASIIGEIFKDDGQSDTFGAKQFNWIHAIDENIIELLFDTLADHYQDSEFDLDAFCREMSMSQSNLYRKTVAFTGLSPNFLLREFRLIESLGFLEKERSIAQAAYSSGFNNPSYFTKCFQKRFGIRPLTFVKLLDQ